MKKNSRTKNATINATVGIITQLLYVFIEFIIRTVFIKILGSEYLGINGLFTNILTVLSFAELGIGNAIIFSMYKEIASDNTERIKSLMQFYKKSYTTIGTIVLLVGIAITPFLNLIIKDTPNINENLYLIYILFLLNTAISYFFTYKKSIILAHQKSYIVNIIKLISEIIKAIAQITVLHITKNFLLYLIIQIACTLIDNIIASITANKMYKYLKDDSAKELEKEEKKNIFSNVKSLILYKFGSVILNGTDNIIISKMLGISTVGIVSNYVLLSNTVTTIIGNGINGFTASIGNLNAEKNVDKQEKVFNQLFFLCVWVYGFCAISFFVLANDFVKIWLGNEYLLQLSAVFAIALHLYVNGAQFAGYTYRTTIGLFNHAKYTPIVAAVLNIILSILFCYKLGVTGILIATSISRLLTTTTCDIYLTFKHVFKKSPTKFYFKYIYSLLSILIIGVVSFYTINLISLNGILGFIVKGIVCTIVTNILFILIYHKHPDFKELLKRVKKIIIRK